MAHELLVTTKRSVVHTAQLVQGSMETRRQSPAVWWLCRQTAGESAAAGSQHARTCSCRTTGSGQMRLYVRRRYGLSFLQLIGAVEGMEVAIDSEDVTCPVLIIRGKANHPHKKKSRSRRWNRSQGSRRVMCDLKMFMSCSNYDLLQTREWNVFVCHSGVLKSTVYEKNPVEGWIKHHSTQNRFGKMVTVIFPR